MDLPSRRFPVSSWPMEYQESRFHFEAWRPRKRLSRLRIGLHSISLLTSQIPLSCRSFASNKSLRHKWYLAAWQLRMVLVSCGELHWWPKFDLESWTSVVLRFESTNGWRQDTGNYEAFLSSLSAFSHRWPMHHHNVFKNGRREKRISCKLFGFCLELAVSCANPDFSNTKTVDRKLTGSASIVTGF